MRDWLLYLFCLGRISKNQDVSISLHTAIEDRRINDVKDLLDGGENIESHIGDDRKLTPLGRSVLNGLFEMSVFLLARGASISFIDSNGNSLMSLAAIANNVDLIELFLQKGLDVDTPGFKNNTPLMIASFYGKHESINYLVLHQAQLGAQNAIGNTAMHLAARENRAPTLELLHNLGADIETRNHAGNTPLIEACREGSIDAVRYLVSHGANVLAQNMQGETALSVAMKQKHPETVLFLTKQNKITLQERLDNIGFKDELPKIIECSITYTIMDEPVTLSTGHTYNRDSLICLQITSSTEGFIKCPMSNQYVNTDEIWNGFNVAIKIQATEFVEMHEKAFAANQQQERKQDVIDLSASIDVALSISSYSSFYHDESEVESRETDELLRFNSR